MKVGFIGLGTMGRHMATNLARAGHDLTIHDLRREAGAQLRAAAWAETPRAVAEASEVVFTSLPGPVEVEAVALGPNGLLEGMGAGKVYVDLSTNDPSVVRRIHQAFAAKGAHVL